MFLNNDTIGIRDNLDLYSIQHLGRRGKRLIYLKASGTKKEGEQMLCCSFSKRSNLYFLITFSQAILKQQS